MTSLLVRSGHSGDREFSAVHFITEAFKKTFLRGACVRVRLSGQKIY